MYVDNNLILSGSVTLQDATLGTTAVVGQAVTGSAAATVLSTNTLDLGTTRDLGQGTDLYLRMQVGTAFASSAPTTTAGPDSIMVEIIQADDVGLTSNVNSVDAMIIPCCPANASGTSITTGGVWTWTNHNLPANTPVTLISLTGGTGLTAGTTYYVVGSSITANTFQVSATAGGAAISPSAAATAFSVYASLMTAGQRYALNMTPRINKIGQRWMGLRYTINTRAGAAGTLFADLGMEIQDTGAKSYPSGFSIK